MVKKRNIEEFMMSTVSQFLHTLNGNMSQVWNWYGFTYTVTSWSLYQQLYTYLNNRSLKHDVMLTFYFPKSKSLVLCVFRHVGGTSRCLSWWGNHFKMKTRTKCYQHPVLHVRRFNHKPLSSHSATMLHIVWWMEGNWDFSSWKFINEQFFSLARRCCC